MNSSTIEGADKARILVIDDEPRIRDACRMVLQGMGMEVAVAANGEEGLAMIGARHYDIVLVDLMMPVLSGFEVLAHIREYHPDTVVVVITGYATLEHSIEAMKKGAFDFIPKPFTPDHLRVVVGKSLRYTRALQDISETKTRLRVMVDRLTDGVMACDLEGRVVLANPAFLQMVGYSDNGVAGRPVAEVVAEPAIRGMIDQALAMPTDSSTEMVEVIHYDDRAGGERFHEVRCAPFRSRTGSTLGVIAVLHDITAIKNIERMKSEFVSMVSHEIRSPMNSLLMQLKVILDGLAGEVTDKQREILERASDKIRNLTLMVSELLDLARIESGQVDNDREPVFIHLLLEEQVTFHRAAAAEKNILLQLEPLPPLPAVLANRRGLEEVFTNLITNAIKYSPVGSRVTVAAVQKDGAVAISVGDTGYGIPEEDLEAIFNRFYRVKDSNTRTIHGTGLGLAIVKGIVKAHGGTIEVTSTLGQGSTFTVTLPCQGEVAV
jgi:PAS domain S-box-containing protein